MSRIIRVAAAQLGPIQRSDSRESVVERLMSLMQQAATVKAELVVYPELALTTFFPRWFVDDISEANHWYETSMPSPVVEPLFALAKSLRIGFCLGYAELTELGERFNTQILVDRDGAVVGKYRKVHIPGHEHHEPDRPFQHAERYYFTPSTEGFPVWDTFDGRVGMMICNDRRWPESYRVMGLQGVELILCGYNTPLHYVPDPTQDPLQGFHNSLVMQSGAYQNGTFVVGVAKGGVEEGVDAKATTSADELVWADCNLDWCYQYKDTLFNFDRYRRPEVYTRITGQRGVDPADRGPFNKL
jgi:predicted amidohydrolase